MDGGSIIVTITSSSGYEYSWGQLKLELFKKNSNYEVSLRGEMTTFSFLFYLFYPNLGQGETSGALSFCSSIGFVLFKAFFLS